MQYAHKNNYVDEICDNLKEGIEESDLVVLSVPVPPERETNIGENPPAEADTTEGDVLTGVGACMIT